MKRGRRKVGSGSYSKLKAQRTNDDIYIGLDLAYHSNRQKGKLQARNQTKNERFMATPNFSKEKLLCLGGAGEEVCVCVCMCVLHMCVGRWVHICSMCVYFM